MTQQPTSKREEASIQELRSVLNTHRLEAIKALKADMFYTAIHETKECTRLAGDIVVLLEA